MAKDLETLRALVGYGKDGECGATFGDRRCMKIPKYTVGIITGVLDEHTIVASALPDTDPSFYRFGRFIIHSCPMENQVKDFNNETKTFSLVNPLTRKFRIGDTFTAYQGCDKKYTSCRDTHNNLVNFRGFYFMERNK